MVLALRIIAVVVGLYGVFLLVSANGSSDRPMLLPVGDLLLVIAGAGLGLARTAARRPS